MSTDARQDENHFLDFSRQSNNEVSQKTEVKFVHDNKPDSQLLF